MTCSNKFAIEITLKMIMLPQHKKRIAAVIGREMHGAIELQTKYWKHYSIRGPRSVWIWYVVYFISDSAQPPRCHHDDNASFMKNRSAVIRGGDGAPRLVQSVDAVPRVRAQILHYCASTLCQVSDVRLMRLCGCGGSNVTVLVCLENATSGA